LLKKLSPEIYFFLLGPLIKPPVNILVIYKEVLYRALKIQEIVLAAGAPPRTPLGELISLPQIP